MELQAKMNLMNLYGSFLHRGARVRPNALGDPARYPTDTQPITQTKFGLYPTDTQILIGYTQKNFGYELGIHLVSPLDFGYHRFYGC